MAEFDDEDEATPTTITHDHRQQAANWRWMVIVLAASLFSTLVVFGLYVRQTEQTRSQNLAVTDCRSKSAAALSSAQVNNDLAFNDLVVGLTESPRRPLDVEVKRIAETAKELKTARDARVAFEQHPTGNC